MKKLFATGSSISIEEFSSLHINGAYSLLKLGPGSAIVKCSGYQIEVSGDDLTVETLSEEVALFTFNTISKVLISKIVEEGVYHDS